MNDQDYIKQKAEDAFESLSNPERLHASEDFFDQVMGKLEEEPKQAVIYTLQWKDTLKYVALFAIMALNSVLLLQVSSLEADSTDLAEEDITTLADEFFPDYYTLNEE